MKWLGSCGYRFSCASVVCVPPLFTLYVLPHLLFTPQPPTHGCEGLRHVDEFAQTIEAQKDEGKREEER